MPIGYLLTVALIACCTLFALAPPRPRRSSPANRSYWFGFLINEQPFLPCYWLLAATLFAFAQGDIHLPGAWATFGLAVLTVAGLAVVARRGLRAGPALDHALREALGNGWCATIEAGQAVRLRRHLPWLRIVFVPWLMRRRDVERVTNIRYGGAGKQNQLDLYRLRSRPAGCPTLVYFHGGAFVSGRKSHEALPLLYRLASHGWVCISANYRLRPAARFPEQHIDAKKVIAWVREHGVAYGVDPALLFVAGSSAGAHLAALVALTPNDPTFQPGFEGVDTSVGAAICLYGYYGGLDAAEGVPSSPGGYVGTGAPPFFVAHGDRDTVVLVEDAREFVERLRSASSNPVVYAELPGAQHTFDLLHSIRNDTVVDAIEVFAAWVRSREPARSA